MKQRVLITGGAGFIGSHLTDHLLNEGYPVRILDSLEPQVHPSGKRPDYLSKEAELIIGSIEDRKSLVAALEGCDSIIHLASIVGVGQSMYEIERYTKANVLGTASLLQTLVDGKRRPSKLIVASSMSLYGEGQYRCASCEKDRTPALRPIEQLEKRDWEPRCEDCQEPLKATGTPETKTPNPTSVYAINKRDQEEMCLAIGRAYKIPTVALRFFNAFGSRQALSNPYTGVAAIFAGRLLNKRAPILFEDGLQSRDFLHVSDLVRGIRLAMESDTAYEIANLGSGNPTTVKEIARSLSEKIGFSTPPIIENKFREGDTRHCFADASKARKLFGFKPSLSFSEGLEELLAWMETQTPEDRGDAAINELNARGLIR